MSAHRPALAIDGGEPEVPPDAHRRWPRITRRDLQNIRTAALAPLEELGHPHSRFLTRLEQAFAAYCGVRYCVAVANGTDAIWAALVAVGVQPGDRVIVPAYSFATAHAVHAAGATPVFCDIDYATYNLDPTQLKDLVTSALPTAIVVVHLHGLPADMTPITKIAEKHDLPIVEDAAQAVGATHNFRLAGSLGHAAAFSNNARKLFQGHEGGLVVTDDPDVYLAVRRVTDYGADRVRLGPNQVSAHLSQCPGRHSRMTPMSAAYLWSQLPSLDPWVATAQRNGEALINGLRDISGIIPPYIPPGFTSAHHLSRIRLDAELLDYDGPLTELRDRVIWALNAEGVKAGLWMPHTFPEMPAFRVADPIPWSRRLEPVPLEPYQAADFPVAAGTIPSTFVLGRAPYPWQVQTLKLVRHYVNAFEKVIVDGILRTRLVLTADYTPIQIVPAKEA